MKLPKKQSQKISECENLSSSGDDPDLEIDEIDEVHSNTSQYILNPRLKASAISLPPEFNLASEINSLENTIQTQENPQQLNWTARTEELYSPKDDKRTTKTKTKKWYEQTAKKHFASENNPRELIRCTQKEKYVWYATYDETMSVNKFLDLLKSCRDKVAPIVFFLITY